MKSETAICKYCGKEFIVDLKHTVYCSKECRLNHNREYNRMKFKSKFVSRIKTCLTCGKEFTVNRYHLLYCSEECRLISKEAKKKQTPKTLYCLICGNIIDPNTSRKCYCSDICFKRSRVIKWIQREEKIKQEKLLIKQKEKESLLILLEQQRKEKEQKIQYITRIVSILQEHYYEVKYNEELDKIILKSKFPAYMREAFLNYKTKGDYDSILEWLDFYIKRRMKVSGVKLNAEIIISIIQDSKPEKIIDNLEEHILFKAMAVNTIR
jgi:predicted nucleic acid-binding Zn ribbon protein